METEITYRVVRAMGWLGLEVGGTVTMTLTDDGNVTCTPSIGADQIHSALQLGYLEIVETNPTVRLNQSEAAEWIESLARVCLAPHCHETDRGLERRCHDNSQRVAGMIYHAGGSLSGPHCSESVPRPQHLRLMG